MPQKEKNTQTNELPAPKTPAQEDAPQAPQKNTGPPKSAKEELYDKIPLSYKQVDIIVKVLLAVLGILVIIGVITGSGIGW